MAIPNDALYADDILKNVNWLEKAFVKRSFEVKVLETERTPLVYAEFVTNDNYPTILFYMHFDGQSIDRSKWQQEDPYIAVLKEQSSNQWNIIDWSSLNKNIDRNWRIFGRSSSDDKGPIVMLLQAIDAMKEAKLKPKVNIKVILDGEEEKGSLHLTAAVKKYKSLLRADHLVINDGPMHLSGQPTLIFGCRGNTSISLTVYGPRNHQHSGHYGNYAPNPVFRMSHLLASMKNEEGQVLIHGYYDGIQLDPEIKQLLAKVPDDPQKIHSTIGIAEPEKVGQNLQEALQYPSLNVRGISAAWTGKESRTIVPAEATVSIDLRLVPESDPDRLKSLIKEHIAGKGYHLLDRAPTEEERLEYPLIATFKTGGATLPFRTDVASPTGLWLSSAINKGWNSDPVKIRIMGGTVPIASFINELQIPAVIVPLVNPDNNQHSPNENLRIGNLIDGIQTFMAIFLEQPK